MPQDFCSSFSLRRHLGGDVDRAYHFANALLESVSDKVERLRINYLYLAPTRAPSVVIGGRKGKREELSSSQFLRRAGNFMPVLGAWWYLEDKNVESDGTMLLDNVQLPVIEAWSRLTLNAAPVVIPNGDECRPEVAAADLFAWVTDVRLGRERLPLRPGNVTTVWRDAPFDTDGFFFDEKFLYLMKSKDTAPARVGRFWHRPMMYLMVDSLLISDKPTGREEDVPEIRLRDWVEERGWMNTVFAYAQRQGGGAKGYNPGDRAFVQDGDTVIWVGEKSNERAEALATAVDIETLSLKDVRKKVKK